MVVEEAKWKGLGHVSCCMANLGFTSNKDSDQSRHPPSLTKVFTASPHVESLDP